MATRVEAFFELHDKMSKQLEVISKASQNTHTNLDQLNRSINRLATSQEASLVSSRLMTAQLAQMAIASQRTESHVKQLTHQVERLAAEVMAFGKLYATAHLDVDTSKAEQAMARMERKNVGVKLMPRGALAMGMYGGIAGVIAPAITAIGAIGGAAAIALPAVAALGGGIVAAMTVGKMAMKPVIEGYAAIKSAEDQIKNAQTWDQRKAGIEALRLAQARLTKEQLQFVKDFKALKEEFKSATKVGQNSIFTGLDAMLQSARKLIPIVAPILNGFAIALGSAAKAVAAFFGSKREQDLLKRTWEPLIPVFRTVLGIMGRLAVVFQGLVIAATPLLSWVLKGLEEKLTGIANTAMSNQGLTKWTQWFENLKPPLTVVSGIVVKLWKGLTTLAAAGKTSLPGLGSVIGSLIDALVALLPSLTNVFNTLPALLGALSKLAPAFAQWINDIVVPAVQILANILTALIDTFNKLPSPVKSALLTFGVLAVAAIKLRGAFKLVRQGIDLVGEGFKLLMRNPVVFVIATIAMALILLQQRFHWVEKTVTVLGKAWSWLGDRMKDIGGVFSTIGGMIKSAFDGVKTAVMSVLGVIYDAFRWYWNNIVANIVNKAAWVVDLIPGLDVGRVPEIPERKFAEGGIVHRPTVALIGEDGPEAVVPLSKPGRKGSVMQGAGMSGAQVGSLVHIGTINVNNGDDYQKFVKRLRADLRTAARDSLSIQAG